MGTYVIIGASSGIGLQLASNLSNANHQVFGTYHTKSGMQSSSHLTYHPLNVLEDELDLDFIPEAIDGLVYCPGSINLKPFNRIKADDFESDFKLQVVGAVKLIQALLPKLKTGTNPSIILFSSVAARLGLPYHTLVSSSKGAIEGLTVSLAAELAPTVRVNCIALSLTDTPMAWPLLSSSEKRTANAVFFYSLT